MGVLLVFGSAVYLLVSVLLINHVDNQLEATVNDIVSVTRVNGVGDINVIKFPPLDMTANVYVQIWGRNERLMTSSPNLSQINESLDADNLHINQPVYHETRFREVHLRVLNVPLIIDGRSVGTLQAASSLDIVDAAREVLVYIMGIATVIAVLLAGRWSGPGSTRFYYRYSRTNQPR